jgi:hypothetical protein
VVVIVRAHGSNIRGRRPAIYQVLPLVSREVRNNGRRFGNSDFDPHRRQLGNTLVDLTPVGCHLQMLLRRKLYHTLAKPSKSG